MLVLLFYWLTILGCVCFYFMWEHLRAGNSAQGLVMGLAALVCFVAATVTLFVQARRTRAEKGDRVG